jgi:hypothetical protein
VWKQSAIQPHAVRIRNPCFCLPDGTRVLCAATLVAADTAKQAVGSVLGFASHTPSDDRWVSTTGGVWLPAGCTLRLELPCCDRFVHRAQHAVHAGRLRMLDASAWVRRTGSAAEWRTRRWLGP